ncbi:hypothetical protein ABW20_dc0101399 [Dactylellina cionopaga]|nr:hypothetical protein ABW20_dc0101399 [Dactylellina cionopaga]
MANMKAYTEMDSVRKQLEAFRFPSPIPTARSREIWSGQHLEPYLPSPRSLSPSPSSRTYLDSNFVDSAYASPSLEEASFSTGARAMTLQDTLSELESIVGKYEVEETQGEDEPKSFWEDGSNDEEDEDYDFVDEAYLSEEEEPKDANNTTTLTANPESQWLSLPPACVSPKECE